jgi:CDP-diacylglycerol pyrophosphatase
MTHPARRLLFVLLLAGMALTTARAADPSALWHIVHDRCVPDEQSKQDPAPCASVDLAHGYAVLKDRDGATQFLLIPTARVSGIEDAAILAPDAPNYWDAAWQARHDVEQRAGHALARDVLSLAINSPSGRTQDQLHIHIDCLRADVRAALAQHQAEIGPQWSTFPVPLAGHRYRAMRLPGADLGGTNPFRLLAAGVPQAEMGEHTLVLAGATFAANEQGFILLDDRADLTAGDRASGEELQDHDCALAR